MYFYACFAVECTKELGNITKIFKKLIFKKLKVWHEALYFTGVYNHTECLVVLYITSERILVKKDKI